MENRLKMGVDKCKDMLSDGMMGRNIGGPGLLDFGEEVEIGGTGIGDTEEGDVLSRRTMEGGWQCFEGG